MGLRGDGAGPDDFEGGFAAHKHLGAFADPNRQDVFGVGAKLAQAFLFGLQAFVRAIQGYAELVRSGR